MSQQVVQKLSTAKQKLSLGEVKKAEKEKEKASNVRKIIRNSVVNPDDLEWPYISEEDEKELIDFLAKELSVLSIPNIHVPLDEIKKVEQGDRRQYRHVYFTQRALEVGFDTANYTKLRMDISIGANCVSRGMEQNFIKAAIIEKGVEPAILTKMLIPVARSKEIPIIAVNGLSETCQKVFKTRCIALGLKTNCVDITHPLHRLFSFICSIHEKISQVNDEVALAYYYANPNTRLSEAPESSDPNKKQTNQKRKSKSAEIFKPPKVRKV